LGAKNITKLGSTALAAGDIVSGRVYQIEYDGTRFQLLNPSTVASFSAGSTGFTPSSATTGAVTLAGTLATTNGGTGLTSFTANGVVYASSSSALATGSALVFDSNNRLSVNQSSSLFGSQLEVTGNGAGQAIGIHGRASDGIGVLQFGANGSSTEYARITSDNTSSLQFGVGSSGTEQMRLTSTGLGIGTSSPATKLQVSANEPKIRLTSTAGSGKSWDISSGGNTTVTLGQFCIYDTTTDSQRFNIASGSGTMLLDGSGNLGLGVTPSAWDTSIFRTLQVGSGVGSASLSGRTDGNQNTYLASNVYYG
jgi:hypothetical protein